MVSYVACSEALVFNNIVLPRGSCYIGVAALTVYRTFATVPHPPQQIFLFYLAAFVRVLVTPTAGLPRLPPPPPPPPAPGTFTVTFSTDVRKGAAGQIAILVNRSWAPQVCTLALGS